MRGEESWLVNVCSADVPDFSEISSKLSLEQIRQAQEKDSVIRQVKELLEVPDKDWKNLDPKVKELLHHRKKLCMLMAMASCGVGQLINNMNKQEQPYIMSNKINMNIQEKPYITSNKKLIVNKNNRKQVLTKLYGLKHCVI